MKFLIVDDNAEFRSYLKNFIAAESDEVAELDDGINLNETYKEFKPDWVLLDIVMKEVNGIKAAEILKQEFPDARFVIVSGYSDIMFRRAAEKCGAAGLVAKENLSELIRIINNESVV